MENKTRERALKFEHSLEWLGDGKFTEYFIPYEVKELRRELLSDKEKDLFKGYVDSGETLLRLDIPLGDVPSEAWVNEGGTYQETSLFDYVADVAYVIESVTWRHGENQSDAATVAQVGILTTVVGIQFLQFKIDFSILYRMLLNGNLFDVVERNREAFINVLYNIAQRSLDSDEDKEEFSKERIRERFDEGQTPKDIMNNLIEKIYATVQKKRLPQVYSLQVSSNYLQQLINAVNASCSKVRKKYKKGQGCFCVVVDDYEIYYAFSGDDSGKKKDKLDELSERVKQNLDREFNRDATRCCISDETLCYGIRVDKEFWAFPEPQPYGKYGQLYQHIKYCYGKFCDSQLSNELSVGSLYGCCERKIFVHTQNQMSMEVHCRWAPCQRCAPAVYEEINWHLRFKYIALAKSFNDLKKKVKDGMDTDQGFILSIL